MVLPLVASCGANGGSNHAMPEGDTIPIKYVTNLTMVDYGDYIKADFRNPWDTTKNLQTFLLIPQDEELPADLPKGTIVRTPLRRSIVYTSVHNSLLEELGASEAVVGACDTKYIRKPSIRRRIEEGTIADCGTSMAPNIEKILQLKPDAILLSAFENSNDHNKVAQTGIPIIDCTDYMESSPLARAEWMKFFGRLYGKGAAADSIFEATEKSYLETKALVKDVKNRPIVLTDLIYGQSWGVPAAYSTTGVLIEDAGGMNPFDTFKTNGSVQLSPEEVLYKAKDADVWILKYSQDIPVTLSQLANDNPIYSKFKAYKNGNIYGCDTEGTTYFEDAAFHPHWILAEYVSMFHPELGEFKGNHHYYKNIQK
ncbi:MAG: ABC transporter substrate-binding protein [Muribaculaceae bacterium]|nr:ABC transporter substrate-binding protein [Muribaculaceae bacterium]MDE6522969.1 ABC transporter substrate-binding protein [Muribaculaceae bacterium]